MERVVLNANTYGSGSVRTERRSGREYLVAPLTLIVSGVLAGSKGPLYYPPDEIRRNVGDWNGVPLVVYHPTWNGQHVSARDPDVLDRYWVGNVYRARFLPRGRDGRARLLGEGWFDVEATRRIDPRVWEALNSNQPIELSTGLFTENEPVAPGTTDERGRPYSYIARNYRPDHLAILPDQVGACSLADGCGVFATNRRAGLTVNAGYFGPKRAPAPESIPLRDLARRLPTSSWAPVRGRRNG